MKSGAKSTLERMNMKVHLKKQDLHKWNIILPLGFITPGLNILTSVRLLNTAFVWHGKKVVYAKRK